MTKIYALFLPQFHADPKNDEWWGDGFTEWTLVKAAAPLFEGHRQPRVPRDGYKLLETAEELDLQFQEAKQGGVDGFIFYHYWSKGERRLRKPLDVLLENPDIAQGSEFSLCWANHAWTRSWQNRAGAHDCLFEQEYETTTEEMRAHVLFLVKNFADPRYSKINGEPVFFIYRPQDIPNLAEFIKLLKSVCHEKLGVNCHVSAKLTSWQISSGYLDIVDSITFSQPATANNAPMDVFEKVTRSTNSILRKSYFLKALPLSIRKFLYPFSDAFMGGRVEYNYDNTWKKILKQTELAISTANRRIYFAGFVDFDNTARYGKRARLYNGFHPKKFSRYLKSLFDIVKDGPNPEFIVVNAWNEWGEGMYLQPDEEFGDQRLDAVRALKK